MRGRITHLACGFATIGALTIAATADDPATKVPSRFPLAEAPQLEEQVLDGLLASPHWARRALAAMRLERFNCPPTRATLEALLGDRDWRVRAFAIRTLARRGETDSRSRPWLAGQEHPRVIRAGVRHRAFIEPELIERGVRELARSEHNDDKLLAAEIGSLAASPDLQRLAQEAARTVILRMSRVEGAAFSPRLAALVGGEDVRNVYEWHRWLQRTGRGLELRELHAVGEDRAPLPPSLLASLDSEVFARMESYLGEAVPPDLDIAFCLDSTGSMRPVFRRTQGAIDDALIFLRDMSSSLRISLTVYRDRGQEFETRGWDFTSDLHELRGNLWVQTAERGGGSSESVYAGMRRALTQTAWRSGGRFLLVIGDGAPHAGEGGHCVEIARRARIEGGIITHTVQGRGDEVKHFPEIAAGGGGRYITLDGMPSLLAEMLGLPSSAGLDGAFNEFYAAYLELCR